MPQIKIGKASLLIDAKNQLGEGPLWHPDENILYWVDITPGLLNCCHLPTGRIQQWQMGSMIGTVTLVYPEGLLVALETGIYWFSPCNGLQKLADFPEPADLSNRFNDGKCDPSGRLWVGTMSKKVLPHAGNLYCFNGKEYKHKLTGLTISNGMAWSADQRKFYFTDSADRTVKEFDFDIQTANISSERVIIETPEKMGVPDGMAIDCEGKLWVAHWGGFCVARWCPETGELLEKIELPVPHVTSCAFGGEDFQMLYITTARDGLTNSQLKKFPLSGGIFQIKPEVKGNSNFLFDLSSVLFIKKK